MHESVSRPNSPAWDARNPSRSRSRPPGIGVLSGCSAQVLTVWIEQAGQAGVRPVTVTIRSQ